MRNSTFAPAPLSHMPLEARAYAHESVPRGLRRRGRHVPQSESLEMTTNVGTPVFAAPELHSSDRLGQYSTKIDVYSFGIIMWTLRARQQTCPQTYVV